MLRAFVSDRSSWKWPVLQLVIPYMKSLIMLTVLIAAVSLTALLTGVKKNVESLLLIANTLKFYITL